jgi:hypothetical protein
MHTFSRARVPADSNQRVISFDAIHSWDMAGLMIAARMEIEKRRVFFFDTEYIKTEYDDCL